MEWPKVVIHPNHDQRWNDTQTKISMSRRVIMANRSQDQKVGKCPRDSLRSQMMTDSVVTNTPRFSRIWSCRVAERKFGS